MRRFLKIIILILIIIFIIYIGFSFVFLKKAKPIISSKIQELTSKPTSIGDLRIKFPFNLEIKQLKIEGLANIEELYLSPDLLGFIFGKIIFHEVRIDKAEFNFIHRTPVKETQDRSSKPEIVLRPKRPPVNFILRKVIVKDAVLNFFDYNIDPQGFRLTLKDIDLSIENLVSLPISVITNFNLEGKIPWPKEAEEGKIKFNGWVNIFKRDIQAHLEIDNIDGIYFYPYYAKWVDLEKSRIESAKLNFKSNINGLNNEVVADCNLELSKIAFRPKQEGESEEKAYQIAKGVLNILKAIDNDKISLNFTIHTRMDNLEFSFENIRMAFENKLSQGIESKKIKSQDILNLPLDFLKSIIKGTTDVTKIFIESGVEIGRSIKDVFTGPFKKEENKP